MRRILVLALFLVGVLVGILIQMSRHSDIVDPEPIDLFSAGIDQPTDSTLSLYTFTNGRMKMSATNWGARVQSLSIDGTDVVLGFDTLEQYQTIRQNFGGIVGRYIGRINGGTYVLDGDTAHLQTQGGGDCGHGGSPNFAARLWSLVPGSLTDTTMTLRYISPDGENGFPGELTLLTTYTLTHDALRIDYQARTTKPTVLNPSNHSFFNLTGDLSADVMSEELWIDSDSLVLYNERKQATGQLGCVDQTPFDFHKPHLIGDSIDEPNFQLGVTGGYDHCFQLRNYLVNSPEHLLDQPVASLYDRGTGIAMQVYTTEPGVHIYTANGLKGNIYGKGNKVYPRRNSICFETMHYPDSPNKPHWPSAALRPGQTFQSTTIFQFTKQ